MDARHKNVAKWGAACAPCATAKAKCLRSKEALGSKCDRCERLFKDCTTQVHRPRKKRTSKPSRTAQLEERLNGLVDLLRVSKDLPSLNRPEDLTYDSAVSIDAACSCLPSDQDPNVSVQQRPTPSTTREDSFQHDCTQHGYFSVAETYNSFAPPSCICRPQSGPIPPASESDEELLSKFQTNMSPIYPFVIIPPGTIPAQLRATKPFLFSVIKMVASMNNNMKSMQAQMCRIMQHISDFMIMRSERSLDLIQGIVVMLGWYHHHCLMHAQMNNLVSLATSLLADLGLNRHPILAERTKLMVLNPDEPSPRTNDERRVFLGVWYLSSCISVGFQRIESIKFSNYVQQCLKDLEDAKEYDTDMLLVHLVRLQHLTEKIFRVNIRDDLSEDVPGIPRAPISAYQSAFQAELDRIHNSLSKSLKNNKFILSHIHTAALHLYEPPVIDATLLHKFSSALTSLTPSQPSALDVFYRSNAALRTWFEHFLTIPVALYQWMPMTICTQIIFSVTMLSRWARLVGPLKGPGPNGPIQVVDPSARPNRTNPIDANNHLTPAPSPSPLAPLNIRETADPGIPAAVAALREQLRSQPELSLDVVGILAAIGAHFDQAHRELGEMSGPEVGSTIWDLSAKKIMITRAKLERWAEIVAAGGAEAVITGLPREEREERDEEDGESDGVEEGSEEAGAAAVDGVFADGMGIVGWDTGQMGEMGCMPGIMEGWQQNSIGGVDFFEGLDPNLWFDAPMDFVATTMNAFDRY